MNPIEYMKFESKNIGKFDNLTNKEKEKLPIKLSTFYEARDKLDKYTQAVTLYGIRRTGKTTVMNQLWDEFKNENSLYLLITGDVVVSDLATMVLNSRYDYVFIDEVTNLVDFQVKIKNLLDLAVAVGTKLVLAGTDSYLISLSRRNAALGRLNLVRFVPIPYSDIQLLNNNMSFLDFYEKGVHVTEGNITTDLIFTIMDSIDKAYKSDEMLTKDYNTKMYQLALQTVTDYIINVIDNKIKAPKYIMSWVDYSAVEEHIQCRDLKSSEVTAFFEILCEIDIIKPMRRFVFGERSSAYAMFYLSVPALYNSYVSNLNEEYTAEAVLKVSGLAFEAIAVTQVLSLLDTLDNTNVVYRPFSIRECNGAYEFDMCVERKEYNKNYEPVLTLTLIEFKRSKSKTSKHFYHPDIVKYVERFDKVNRYIVYAVDNKDLDSNITRVSVEDFLANLEEYLS